LTRAARVAREHQLRRNTLGATEHAIQSIDRRGHLIVASLFYRGIRQALTLILLSVLHGLKRSKANASAAWHHEQLLLLAVARTKRKIDLLCSLDQVILLGHFFAEEHRVEMLAVPFGLDPKLAQHPIGLATTTSSPEEDLP
jgi:hypothetical protein